MKQVSLKFNNLISKKGFGVVEIIIATTIIGIVAFALVQLGVIALWMTQRSSDQTQAGFLLQEAAEAVRFLRDDSWDNNISTLSTETDYFLIWDGNNYSLSEIEPPLINNKFRRTVVLSQVFRNVNDDIDTSGNIDLLTKKITITVGWDDRGNPVNRVVDFYIVNLLNN